MLGLSENQRYREWTLASKESGKLGVKLWDGKGAYLMFRQSQVFLIEGFKIFLVFGDQMWQWRIPSCVEMFSCQLKFQVRLHVDQQIS